MNLYESYGRQAEMLFQLKAYFETTQDVLRGLKAGEVLPSQLVVTDKGWEVGPVPEEPRNGKGTLELVKETTHAGAHPGTA